MAEYDQDTTEHDGQLGAPAKAEAKDVIDPFDPRVVLKGLLESCDKQTNAPITLRLVSEHVAKEDYETVLQILRQRENPPVDILYFLGVVYYALGRDDEAQAALERMIHTTKTPPIQAQRLLQKICSENDIGVPKDFDGTKLDISSAFSVKGRRRRRARGVSGEGGLRKLALPDDSAQAVQDLLRDRGSSKKGQ